MNIATWMLAGGIPGWMSYWFLHFNLARGVTVSILIGAVGGFSGGQMIAPLFSAAATTPVYFGSTGLYCAAVGAVIFLTVDHLIYERWGTWAGRPIP